MFINNKSKGYLIITSIAIIITIVTLTGCYERGPSPNLQTEFKEYNNSNALTKDPSGYADSIDFTNIENGYEFTANQMVWGALKLIEADVMSEQTINISVNCSLSEGNYKIILIDSDNNVNTIVEDETNFSKEVKLTEGQNTIKLIGKPVNFDFLAITISSSDNFEGTKNLSVMHKSVDFNIDTNNNKNNINTDASSTENNNTSQLPSKIDSGTLSPRVEKGEFSSLTLLSNDEYLLNGKKLSIDGYYILFDNEFDKSVDLNINLTATIKSGSYSLELINDSGETTILESDSEVFMHTIKLEKGRNTLAILGDSIKFDDIKIGYNSDIF